MPRVALESMSCRLWKEVCIRPEAPLWGAVASPNPLGSVMPAPPGLPGFVEASPVQAPPQPTVESVLLHTVQQQQNQVAQLTSLVQTLEQGVHCKG